MSEDLKRAVDALWLRSDERNRIPGRMGRLNTDGSYTIDVAARPGWVYVRVGPEGDQGHTIAVNLGVARIANLPIWMRRIHGRLVIKGVDESGRLDAFIGSGNFSYGVGPHTHRIGSGLEYELEALRMEMGRIKPFSGLTVAITDFRYFYNGFWYTYSGGTIDLTSYKPAANTWAWVLVGLDPVTNMPVAATGAAQGLTTPLTLDQIDAIAFDDYIPLGAVKVKGSDTTLNNLANFQDAHGWFNGWSSTAAQVGWTVDYNALIPTGRDAFIPGTVTVLTGFTLTVSGELFVI